MKMNKRLLVTAISTALLLGAVDSMAAAFDISNTSQLPLTYAKEIKIAAAGTTLTNDATSKVQDITGKLSTAAIGSTTGVEIKITLSNGAKFKTAPAVASILDTATTPVAQSFPLVAGGAGSSFATFQGTSGAGFALNTIYTVGVTDIDVINNSPVSVTSDISIQNKINPAAPFITSKTLPYITFNNAFEFKCTAPTAGLEKVDVTKSSFLFTGGTFTASKQGAVQLVTTGTTAPYTKASVSATPALLNSGSVKFTNANGWAAFAAAGASAKIGAKATVITGNDAAVAAADVAATFTAITTAATDFDLAVPAAANTAIAAGDITAAFTSVAAVPAEYDAVSGSCSLAPIKKTGSEDRLTFVLAPSSIYKNFIRITNPSTTAGNAYITMIDDTGLSVPLNLTDVGQASNVIAAGASTVLLSTADLGNAAKVKNPAYNVTARQRMIVNGDFGSTGSNTGINVQSLSVSKTGETFGMMNAK